MTSKERLCRAHFQVVQTKKAVAQLVAMIDELASERQRLTRFIAEEEDRTKVRDRTRNTYSLAAIDAAQRGDRLDRSIADLKLRLERTLTERHAAIAHHAISKAPAVGRLQAQGGHPPLEMLNGPRRLKRRRLPGALTIGAVSDLGPRSPLRLTATPSIGM